MFLKDLLHRVTKSGDKSFYIRKNLWSANDFNLDEAKILSSGKEINKNHSALILNLFEAKCFVIIIILSRADPQWLCGKVCDL